MRARRWTAWIGMGLMALGLVVSLGWWLDIAILRSFHSGFVAMRINAALGLALGGLALWQPGLRRVCACGMLAIGGATLGEYLTGWNLGIDELLVRDTTLEGPLAPGRMAPSSALDLVFVGLSLLLLESRSPRRQVWGQRLAVLSSLVALISLQAYIFSLAAIEALAPFSYMALPAALGFLLLGMGVLLIRPEVGFMGLLGAPADSARSLRRLLPALVLSPLALGFLHAIGAQAGLYSPGVGMVLFGIADVVLLGGLMVWSGTRLIEQELRRRDVEAELRESRARLERVVESSNDGFWDWHVPSGRITYSARWCQMLGYQPDEVEQSLEGWQRLVHPEDGSRALEMVESHTCGKIPRVDVEFRLRTRSGAWKWVLSRGRVVTWVAEGQPEWMTGTHTDVDDRHRAQEALAEAKQRLEAVVEQSPLAIIEWDLEGRVSAWNPAAEETFGWTREEALGSQPVSPGDWDAAHLLNEVNTKADRAVRCEWFNARLVNPQGEPAGVVSIVRDVTELHRAEQEMKAREAAEEASRLKSEFLANMSHEIRTPLHTIMGMAHLAGTTELTARQRNYLDSIQAAGRGLMRIIDDILDFSKIEAGKLALEETVFSLQEVLDNLVRLQGAAAAERGLELKVSLDAPRHVRGDPVRLGQVLLNLVSNAIRFTERGEVAVEVSAQPAEQGFLVLRCSVRDTGIGMSSEQTRQLFTPFFQADSSASRHYGGTGLGLAICKRLVHLMGGEIGVQSAPGAGSSFTFTCRVGEASEVAAPPGSPEPPDLKGRGRVLVVEDHLVNQQIARELLERAGLEVDVASNGREALELVRQAGPTVPWGLVLMDLQMPEMDGYTATPAIRALPGLQDLPIVALTAHALPEERRRCEEAGMNDYVSKPVDPEKLYAAVGKWLPLAPAPVVIATFPEIPGVDTRAGLARLAGNRERYRLLLRDASSTWPRTQAELQAALDASDLPRTRQLAHGLRGAAANLGVTAVAREAAELESWARQADAARARLSLQALASELEQAEAHILASLPVPAGEPPSTSGPRPELLERLAGHLEASEGAALDCLQELRAGNGTIDTQVLDSLTRHVEEFDFPAALAVLQTLKGGTVSLQAE